MTLTKDERYTAYCIMLQEFEDSSVSFLCSCMKLFGLPTSENSLEFFPELFAHKKKEWNWVWWPKTKSDHDSLRKPRIAALKQCIEETSNF